ncbi:MAG: NADH-quinone oxidoreductase subunit H [Deltaproteobacteria bacterium]|nr:NADH-quinone oxidoreductase subunit H [Deltaproteobacteria bacterium]
MNEWAWFGAMVLVAVGILMTIAPLLTLAERRIAGFIQGRYGPNRVGPFGAAQPVADLIKGVMKEQMIPEKAERGLYLLAPVLVFVPPAFGFAVIPFGNAIGEHKLQVVNLPIGMLFVMSVLSVGVYGITLGGWASNNKYALLGSLRAAAQLISYELSMGLTILLVVMMAGSVDPQTIVWEQVNEGWNLFGGRSWWALPCGLVGGLLFYVCALAENNRLPFDLAECEAELIGGYHTEYSGMNFLWWLFSEYVAMILSASLITTLFLGGWDIPFVHIEEQPTVIGAALSMASFLTKVILLLVSYIWVRWTLPRFKYNQLMDLGWKAFLPTSLVNIGAMAIIGVFLGG